MYLRERQKKNQRKKEDTRREYLNDVSRHFTNAKAFVLFHKSRISVLPAEYLKRR